MGKLKKAIVDLLIKKRIERTSKMMEKKLAHTNLDSNFQIDSKVIEAHKQKWGRIFKGKINLGWLQWYSKCTGITSPDFIPESVFYTTVEPILNDARYDMAFVEKNFYDLMYPDGIFPETIIRNIDELYFDRDYKALHLDNDQVLMDQLKGLDKIIIKPSTESGGGRDVELYTLEDGKFMNRDGQQLTLQNMARLYKTNFLIQKILPQHSFPSFFNATSLNTVRVLTYRSDVTNTVNILQVVFRVGATGQFLDNSRAGGYSIGVDAATGKLNKFAFRKDGTRYEKVNEVNLAENEYTIPLFDEILSVAKLIAERNIHHRMHALDMAIDHENNIRCLEINNKGNEINFHQLNNGTLFGDFTDEVITYCEKHMDKLYRSYTV